MKKRKPHSVNELLWYYEDGNDIWVTRKGKLLKISEMETGHLKNCIRLILRKNKWRRTVLSVLLIELYTKREMG